MLASVLEPAWPEDVRLCVVGAGMLQQDVEEAAARWPDRIMYLGSRRYAETAGVSTHSAR